MFRKGIQISQTDAFQVHENFYDDGGLFQLSL